MAQLAERQRRRLPTAEVVRVPRLRRLGRRLRLITIAISLWTEWLLTRGRSPRYRLGRLSARWQLRLSRLQLDPRLLLFLVLGVPAIVGADLSDFGGPVTEYLVGAAIGGFLFLAWSDWIRSPFQASRLRRRIRRRPELVLPYTVGELQSEIVPREDLLDRIPREDLYDEAILGVLPRYRSDVQIIVGGPGAGKTTALVGLAERLAMVGMVPVFVPLKPNENAGLTLDLARLARDRFEQQVRGLMRSDAELDTLWQWLYRRRRVAVLTDDVDQIGPDGEKGFVLRRTLEALACEDLPVIVTARPAGIPAGVAASAIRLGELDEDDVVAQLTKAAENDPGARHDVQASETDLRAWVREGRLTEIPFYLELLSALDAVGRCPPLLQRETSGSSASGEPGRYRPRADGGVDWNPHWARFILLERYYDALRMGQVHVWLAIGKKERRSSLEALERAGLGVLVSLGLEATLDVRDRASGAEPAVKSTSIEDFLDSDDRQRLHDGRRLRVSAHEVVDAGERLRLLERTPEGVLQFRHRIMQSYLAGRSLYEIMRCSEIEGGELLDYGSEAAVARELESRPAVPASQGAEATRPMPLSWWIFRLVDDNHPDKLTAHMTLLFAALHWHREHPRRTTASRDPVLLILNALMASAWKRIGAEWCFDDQASVRREDCYTPPDPFAHEDASNRRDPDEGLLKLTTAADIAYATNRGANDPDGDDDELLTADDGFTQAKLVARVRCADGATRWTKLSAIRAIAALETKRRWRRIHDYTADRDYEVRRAASAEVEAQAYGAYEQLHDDIERLLTRAACLSARDLDLTRLESDGMHPAASPLGEEWTEDDGRHLNALGWLLPAIVSGLREDFDPGSSDPLAATNGAGSPAQDRRAPGGDGADSAPPVEEENKRTQLGEDERARWVRKARRSLDRIVTLALQRGQHDLEAALAQGFKSDAMRHADDPERRFTGPGWIASNRRLVATLCLEHAEFWYSRMLLHQALALYAISGADSSDTLNMYARLLRPPREPHPFAHRAAGLARKAIARHGLGSERWRAMIWTDEGEVANRRGTTLNYGAARLVADVTLLLNLNEEAGEDRKAQFGYTEQLPHCLHASRDRREILGGGCPPSCGWEMCPYRQPPPDEPNAHRGVSRAFCRHQKRVALSRTSRRPPWQRAIRRRALANFWHEMERRART